MQHRSIIRYTTGAPRDFEILRGNIAKRIKALLEKAETLSAVTDISATRKIEGLEQHEVVTLAAIGENIDTAYDKASVYQIRRDMEQYGFTKLATTMALKTLQDKSFIQAGSYTDQDGDNIAAYALTRGGWEWILSNKQQFVLKRGKSAEDDIPF